MGFKLGCDDGQSYTIGFTRRPFVQLISIAAATCAADVPSPSPQQVARAAPLIDRTFQTTAACEADCASGDCLAFRHDGETAMTCIVHCKSDGDCPSGFACNGPAQPVQSVPRTEEADAPLTGICVRAARTSIDTPSRAGD